MILLYKKNFMLNLVRKNILLVKNKEFLDLNIIKSSKYFPSSTREWKNSIYLYNKDNLKIIPNSSESSKNIIKAYFALFNTNIENKIRTQRIKNKFRALSKNKVWISNGEFKHTNNKVIISLYLYNRQKKNYLISIKKYKKILFNKLKRVNNLIPKLLKRSLKIKLFGLKNKLNHLINKNIKELEKNSFLQNSNNYIDLFKFPDRYLEITKNQLLLYWYYRQLIYINNSKYNYTFLQCLKEELYKLYNKDIEFNLINLKHFYLHSDILTESIARNISRNRRKMKYYLRKLKNKVIIRKRKIMLHKYIINNKLEKKINLAKNNKNLELNITKDLKYKKVSGFRIEARGRLTKRNTASRTITKICYKGNLYNVDSSVRGLSTVLLKGNLNSNVQYSTLGSRSGIGSFGIKGWVAGN